MSYPSIPSRIRVDPNSITKERPRRLSNYAIRKKARRTWSRPSIMKSTDVGGTRHEGWNISSTLSNVSNLNAPQLVSNRNELENSSGHLTSHPNTDFEEKGYEGWESLSNFSSIPDGEAPQRVDYETELGTPSRNRFPLATEETAIIEESSTDKAARKVSFTIEASDAVQEPHNKELQEMVKTCVLQTMESVLASRLFTTSTPLPDKTSSPTTFSATMTPTGLRPCSLASTQSGILDFLTPGSYQEMNCRDPYNTPGTPCDVPKPRNRQFTIVNDLAPGYQMQQEPTETTTLAEEQRTKVILTDKLPILPDFNGTGKSDIDVFLGRFRNNCHGYKISNHDRTRYMALAFKGRVAKWFIPHMNNPGDSEFYKDNERLITALQFFFGDGNENAKAYNAFTNFAYIKNETVIATITRFENILFEMGRAQDETLMIQQFRAGLSTTIRNEMDALAGLRDRPTDMTQCRRLALRAESDLLIKKQETANIPTCPTNPATPNGLSINTMQDEVQAIRGPECHCFRPHIGPCLICSRCNRKGHVDVHCHVSEAKINLVCDKCNVRGHLKENCLTGLSRKDVGLKLRVMRGNRAKQQLEARLNRIITAPSGEQQENASDEANADTSYELYGMRTLQIYSMRSEESISLELSMMADGRNPFLAQGLVDSGASGNFMDEDFVNNLKLTTTKLNYSIRLTLADGKQSTGGFITHEIRNLQLTYGEHTEVISFLITKTPGTPVILGMPWLKKHNPHIDWVKKTVSLGESKWVVINVVQGSKNQNCM